MHGIWPKNERWASLADLLTAMRSWVEAGRTVVLSPETANIIIMALEPRPAAPSRWDIDLYKEGSCIYQLDSKGEIFRLDAWARNTIAARGALDVLKERHPNESFSMRRGAWVED
jgi:hypothetical protein